MFGLYTTYARRPGTNKNCTIWSKRIEIYWKTSKEMDKSEWCHNRLVPLTEEVRE